MSWNVMERAPNTLVRRTVADVGVELSMVSVM